jgi:hypothetical protein
MSFCLPQNGVQEELLSISLVIKLAIIIQKTNFFFAIYSSVITMYYLNINYHL